MKIQTHSVNKTNEWAYAMIKRTVPVKISIITGIIDHLPLHKKRVTYQFQKQFTKY